MFDGFNGMLTYLGDEDLEENDIERIYFLMKCPTWRCKMAYEINSIEKAMEHFNWSPERIDPDSEEFIKRIIAGKVKTQAEFLAMISGIKLE